MDNALIQAEEGKPDYIAKIVELFETVNKEQYLTAQWFYRAEDTVRRSILCFFRHLAFSSVVTFRDLFSTGD